MSLKKLAKIDQTNLFHPITNLKSHAEDEDILILDKGEGVYVYDTNGKKYLEGLAGLWCTSLGILRQRHQHTALLQIKRWQAPIRVVMFARRTSTLSEHCCFYLLIMFYTSPSGPQSGNGLGTYALTSIGSSS